MSESEFIKAWLREQGATQTALGERFGVAQRTMGRLLKTGSPSTGILARLLIDEEFAAAYAEFKGHPVARPAVPAVQSSEMNSAIGRLSQLLSEDQMKILVEAIECLQFTDEVDLELFALKTRGLQSVRQKVEEKSA